MKSICQQAEIGKITLQNLQSELDDYLLYFTSSKFAGENDYVRTHEVLSRILSLRDQISQALEQINLPIK